MDRETALAKLKELQSAPDTEMAQLVSTMTLAAIF